MFRVEAFKVITTLLKLITSRDKEKKLVACNTCVYTAGDMADLYYSAHCGHFILDYLHVQIKNGRKFRSLRDMLERSGSEQDEFVQRFMMEVDTLMLFLHDPSISLFFKSKIWQVREVIDFVEITGSCAAAILLIERINKLNKANSSVFAHHTVQFTTIKEFLRHCDDVISNPYDHEYWKSDSIVSDASLSKVDCRKLERACMARGESFQTLHLMRLEGISIESKRCVCVCVCVCVRVYVCVCVCMCVCNIITSHYISSHLITSHHIP